MSENNKASFNWFPGHMNKAIKEIEEKISVVDLVIEIVDARAPYSTQNPLFRRILSKRPKLIILSKADLANKSVTKEWEEYFLNTGNKTFTITDKNKNITKEIEKLINKMTFEKQEKMKSRGIERPILNVLVVGIPNVGKSTFIQNVTKGKVLKTANKPGVTRGMQRINMTPQITLIDTPGILPARFENEVIACNCAAANAIRLEAISKERFISRILRYIYNNYPGAVKKVYGIEESLKKPIDYDDTIQLVLNIANNLKLFTADEQPDFDKVTSLFINDLHQFRFGQVSFELPEEVVLSYKKLEFDDVDTTVESDLTIEW